MNEPPDGQLIEANGISLYVEDHGDGVPVLLIHGFPDSARLWRHQVPCLVANGFRVITPDMRGFGRSGITTSGSRTCPGREHSPRR